MDEEDLVCNYKKCRKRLQDVAYVTACSHVFCDEHGSSELMQSKVCPACETSLTARFEIVRSNLKLSDQSKSMMLAGLKPDVISDICFRALTFWVYQSYQEKTYQEHMANRAKEKASQLELYYEQTLARTNAELNSLRQQLAVAKTSLEETKKKCTEVSDKLMEKARQHQKLQSMYDNMRRKYVTMSSMEARVPTTPNLHLPINAAAGDARFEFNPSSGSVASLGMLDATGNHRIKDNFNVGFPTPRR